MTSMPSNPSAHIASLSRLIRIYAFNEPIFIIFLIWRLFMNNTQKALINQDVCEQTTPNLGITQSSGLDRLSGYPDKRSVAVNVYARSR